MQYTAQRKSDILTAINAVSEMVSSTETHDTLIEQLNAANAALLQAEQQRDAAQAALSIANDKMARAKAQIEAANTADVAEEVADAAGDVARASALSILSE